MTEPILHPLINNIDSKHYQTVDLPKDKTTIEDFENDYSVRDLIAWAKITAAKYRHPSRAKKNQIEADKRKEKTYIDYYNMLRALAVKDPTILEMTAQKAYEKHDMNWRYN